MKKIVLFCCVCIGTHIPMVGFSETTMADAKTYHFRSSRVVGDVDRIESNLEVSGNLKIVEKSKVKRPKMSVSASLNYEERTLSAGSEDPTSSRSLRYYDKSEAVLKVGDGDFKPKLREEQRLIGVDIAGKEVNLFGPRSPLTREELDMIDLLGNSLLLDRLLPENPVTPGDSWKHSNDLIASLLGLDAIAESNVKSTFSKIVLGAGQFEMEGNVSGAIAGVSSEIQVRAKYLFDINKQRIIWFAILLKEDRDVGHIGPGLDVTARLQMKIATNVKPNHLTDQNLAGLALPLENHSTQLIHHSATGGWQFMHDRRWFVTSTTKRSTILCMVDRGDFLAQCKIATMSNGDEAKKITLEKFQADIRRGLGKAFKQFVGASQRENEAGYREFRVEISGLVEDVSIHWVYYLLTDRNGRQVLFAFIVEQPLLNRFAEIDQILISSVRLIEPKVAATSPSDQRSER